MEHEQRIAIGVDIGGTFTDVILLDEAAGRLYSAKLPTTPDQPAEAVLAAVAQVLADANRGYAGVRTIVHGTTLATNAIIERKGAATALLTTRGFRDVLETRTELRYDLYDLFIEFPEPLVPRDRRIGLAERVRFNGEIETPLAAAELEDALHQLRSEKVEAIAVSFLHAYANAANEQAAATIIGTFSVTCASSAKSTGPTSMRGLPAWRQKAAGTSPKPKSTTASARASRPTCAI